MEIKSAPFNFWCVAVGGVLLALRRRGYPSAVVSELGLSEDRGAEIAGRHTRSVQVHARRR